MMLKKIIWICLIGVSLVSCKTQSPKDGTAINSIQKVLDEPRSQQMSQAPPAEVMASLMPAMNIQFGPSVQEDKRFDVSVIEVPAREFFMSLVDDTPYNMVVHPKVSGNISLTLKNVSIPDVMDVLRDIYGYEYQRNRSGYSVLPSRLQSKIYQVNYLNVKRTGNSEMQVSSGQVSQSASSDGGGSSESSPSSKVVTESNSNFWVELEAGLALLVGSGEGRSVIVSPHTGIVVVRAMPSELREAEQFLRTTQGTLQRQVILEAKIIEVELKDGFQSGINWGKLGSIGGKTLTVGQIGGGTSLASDTGISGTAGNSGSVDPATVSAIAGLAAQAFGGVFSAAISAGSFTAFIELLESQGNVQVLSSPRIATVNNQKAVIKVGQDEFYVTDVSTTTVTGNTTSSTPDITLTPFFSGIALDVTPQVDSHGGVTLHIHPSVSEVVDQSKTFTIDDKSQTLPLALSRVRESDSIVYARSGQIVVIGGLMQEATRETTASTPLLGDIPFLGSAFRQTKQSSSKSELIILLKPITIDNPDNWGEDIAGSSRRINALNRGFHYGGKTEIFGSEGERAQ